VVSHFSGTSRQPQYGSEGYLICAWPDQGVVAEITANICSYHFPVDAVARYEVLIHATGVGCWRRWRCHVHILGKDRRRGTWLPAAAVTFSFSLFALTLAFPLPVSVTMTTASIAATLGSARHSCRGQKDQSKQRLASTRHHLVQRPPIVCLI
jgi:hypothetical protein